MPTTIKGVGKMSVIAIEKYNIKGFPAPRPIASDEQNDHYTEVLYRLERKDRLTASEEEYAELLTMLIETYEEKQYPIRAASPVEVIRELMAANNLKQKDLAPLLGTESAVSMILNGERPLTKHHIEKLSERFNVSPELFF